MKKNPMQFDEEELQILQDFERGEFESIRNFQSEKLELEKAARNTLQKDKPKKCSWNHEIHSAAKPPRTIEGARPAEAGHSPMRCDTSERNQRVLNRE